MLRAGALLAGSGLHSCGSLTPVLLCYARGVDAIGMQVTVDASGGTWGCRQQHLTVACCLPELPVRCCCMLCPSSPDGSHHWQPGCQWAADPCPAAVCSPPDQAHAHGRGAVAPCGRACGGQRHPPTHEGAPVTG